MKYGIMPPSIAPIATPEFIREVAAAAERLGYHSLWAPEHVVLFDEYASRYPYTEDGRLVGAGGGPVDQFLLLTIAAAATTRLRLGTGICLVPQRNPLYTAKEVASLDWLSGGRFDFGIGIGWLKEEFEALGVPWAHRGARTVDYLHLMQKLWAEGTASHASEFYTMPECRQDPKPIQQPHPPFVFGGESDAALRRVAEIGQGWFGFDLDPAGAGERLGKLENMLADRGRSLAEIHVSVCPMRRRVTTELVREYEAAGVQQLILLAGGRTSDIVIDRMAAMADELGMAMTPA